MHGAVCSVLLLLPAVWPNTYWHSATLGWFSILVPTVLLCGFLSVSRQKDYFSHGRLIDRQHSGSLLELTTFSWARKTLSPGQLKSTTIRELPSLQANLTAEHLSKHARSSIQKSNRLVVALARMHAYPLLLQLSLAVLHSFVALAPHAIMYHLLDWLGAGPERSKNHGLGLALLLGAAVIGEILVESWLTWVTNSMVTLPIHAILNSMVYRKALLLPTTSHGLTEQRPARSVVTQMTTYR